MPSSVRVLYWKEIPYAVRATDGAGQTSRQLPPAFHEAIDQMAMNDGATGAEAYQAGFRWTEPQERPEPAAAAADAAVADLVRDFPPDRLNRIAARRND
jgi:hypothetical protein